MNYRLAPSILSGNFANLGEQIRSIEAGGASDLHFDVMDGIFVPNISFGIPVLKSLKPFTGMFMDVHLMITDPIRYVQQFADAGADMITFHVEACESKEACFDVIGAIRDTRKQVGISYNPETPSEAVYPFADVVDMVLVMGVHPGFGGQGMEPGTCDKVREMRRYMQEHGITCDIEVDGGVKLDNVDEVLDAGANVIVAGSAVFKGDVQANAADFMERIRAAEVRS